jgi:hypothetical protein
MGSVGVPPASQPGVLARRRDAALTRSRDGRATSAVRVPAVNSGTLPAVVHLRWTHGGVAEAEKWRKALLRLIQGALVVDCIRDEN